MTAAQDRLTGPDRFHVPVADSQEGENWLLVYLDVITLLLVMFVVMLAFAGSSAREATTEVVTSPVQDQSSPPDVAEAAEPPEPAADAGAPTAAITTPDPLAGLDLSGLGENIDVVITEGNVSFRISSEILFGSGQAEVSQAGFDELQKLVPILLDSELRVTVTGHTDPVPIRTERFPSNWELSSARAGSVVRYLEARGIDPARLRAIGYASSEPIADNSTEAGRALNRRVELILEAGP